MEKKRGIKIGFLKVAFWNGRAKNKHEKFWKKLEEWDVNDFNSLHHGGSLSAPRRSF